MKFEIRGNKEEVKKFLEEFIRLAEEEYGKQTKDLNFLNFEFPPFVQGYYEENEKIIYYNSFSMPKALNFFQRRLEKKMEKNMEKFFSACGVEVKVKRVE